VRSGASAVVGVDNVGADALDLRHYIEFADERNRHHQDDACRANHHASIVSAAFTLLARRASSATCHVSRLIFAIDPFSWTLHLPVQGSGVLFASLSLLAGGFLRRLLCPLSARDC